jgi:hypothetical protein
MNTRFIYKSFWRSGEIIATSSEQAQFPADNTQDDIKSLVWNSRNGSGTGNGQFIIDSTNKYIDFDEGGAELTATLTEDTYNGQTLCDEVKTQLDANGALTYTVSYSEATGKFTIAATSNFTLRWQSGTNTANTAGVPLGFDVSANDTGTDTYTGDYISIHTSESIDNDMGAEQEYDFIGILGHNLTSNAVIKILGADDAAFTTNVVTDTLTHNGNNIFEFLDTARAKRYSRFYVEDPTNPALYVKIGVIVVGKYVETNREYGPNSSGTMDDSETELSPANCLFIVQEKPKLRRWELPFKGLNDASDALVELMRINNGVTKALVFCTNYTDANNYSYWVHFTETTPSDHNAYKHHDWAPLLEEVL